MLINLYRLTFLSFFFVLVLGTSCEQSKQSERFISDKDTTYSADVRNISAKINADPNNPELYYRRANTFFFEDNYDEALMDIRLSLKLDSLNPLYHYSKGRYLMAGDTANALDAEESFKTAITLKPDFRDAKMELATIYLAKQKYAESEKLLEEVNKAEPAFADAYFYLGVIAREKKDTFKAVALFERLLTFDDKHYNAVMQLGNLYAVKHDPKALAFFNRAIELNEFSDEAYYAKGLFLQKEGKYKDAEALYETVVRMNPAHIFCRYNLAFIHGQFGNYDKAIGYIQEVMDLAPNHADAYAMRGKINELRNQNGRARIDYQKALEIDSTNVNAKAGLQRVGL